MEILINGNNVEVLIKRKRIKRTYLRVLENHKILVSTNYLTRNKDILKLINDHEKFIIKNLELRDRQSKYNDEFFYLGKKYDIIYGECEKVIFNNNQIFLNEKIDINKWLKKNAKEVFGEELDKIYKIFPISIPYPSLTIRSMKTRWGVCNVKTKRVTLNLNLIKRDIKYLDYVIVHELSHLIYPNHSKDFWHLVSMLIPDYKTLRKELNSYE